VKQHSNVSNATTGHIVATAISAMR